MIFHSDRGSQDAGHEIDEVPGEQEITASRGGKSNCWNNAVSETLFASLNAERMRGRRIDGLR